MSERSSTHVGSARCPRCKGLVDADISEPWERHDGVWEWVKVRPHLHYNTGRSTCRPRGYARRSRRALGGAR